MRINSFDDGTISTSTSMSELDVEWDDPECDAKEDRHTASGVALPLAEKHTLHHQHHLLQPSSAQTVTVCGEARPIFVVWDTNDTFCPDERDRT